ncbi:sugar transferase [Kitasatospora sp. NPDC096147]|uniref:sugar transferase n=1 Tax=Kitasatospora sp. NPDC096147 TaxID=3364093 RepID=UPI003819CCE6
MTIDHESVPRPGQPVQPPSRRAATELLERRAPRRATTARSAPPIARRYRRRARFRIVRPAALVTADCLALSVAIALTDPLHAAGAVLPFLLALNLAGGLYRNRLTLSALDEFPALAARATVATAFAVTLAACLEGWPDSPASPLRLLALLTVFLLTAATGRALVYRMLRRGRRRRPGPTLVLGAGQHGQKVAAALAEHPDYGLSPVGFLDSDPVLLAEDGKLPVLGGREAIGRVIRRHRIRHVIATDGATGDAETAASLRKAAQLGCEVWLVPSLREYGAVRGKDQDHIWGFPCLQVGRPAMQRPGWIAKRLLDIGAAGFGLLLVSPLLAAVALAVRLDTGPGVLFRQQRTGLDGRVFTVLKFRTLRPANEHESATHWNISQDHRMSPVGHFLRKSSLDELPQLWNVLCGDMSLVGPRPERPYFVMRFGQAYPEYADRHRVPVGLTGLAQVNGLRGDTSIEDRARFDNRYIESWSLWLDVKTLFRTAALMLHPDGS